MLFFRSLLIASLLLGVAVGANAQIAVVVAQESSISTLSKQDVSRIFLSKTSRLPDGNKALTVEPSATRYQEEFYAGISGKNSAQLKAYWATMIFTGKGQPPRQFETSEDVLRYIQEHPNAIGYVPLELANLPAVKIVLVLK